MVQGEIDWDTEFDFGASVTQERTVAPRTVAPAAVQAADSSGPQSSGVLYVDIETIPDYDRRHLFGLPPLPSVPAEMAIDSLLDPVEFLTQNLDEMKAWFSRCNPPGEWLDRLESAERSASGKKGNRKGVFDLISAARSSKTSAEDVERAQRKKMSTTPEMCRIVAIGLAVDDRPVVSLVAGVDGVTERAMLETFWSLARKTETIAGFNCSEFDLPAIFVRSILLDVPATKAIDSSRYSRGVVDVFARRFNGFRSESSDVKTSRGLKSICRQMGIEAPCDGVDGSQVEELFRTNPTLLGQYVASDVTLTRKLHWLYTGYFC